MMVLAFSGSKIDLWKAFDRIDRDFVMAVVVQAGFPRDLARTYLRYMNSLQYRNTLAVGLGQLHFRELSIPQGCPWSMALRACVLRSWCGVMRDYHTVPRVLVDDLRVFAFGRDHDNKLQRALDATINYIGSIGGRVSTGHGKSSVFSSDTSAEKRLADLEWEIDGVAQRITLVDDERDIGAHANYTRKKA